MNIPKDPVMLLSFLNTQLRDHYPSLEELCQSLGLDSAEICRKLQSIGYEYQKETNSFR